MNRPEFYNWKVIKKLLGVFLGLVFLCKFSAGAAFAVLIPALVYTCSTGHDFQVLYVLFLTVLGTILNSYFIPKTVIFNLSNKLVLLMAAAALGVRLFAVRPSRLLSPLLALVPYLIFMTLTAPVGWQPTISYLKLVLFSLSLMAMYGAADKVMRRPGGEAWLRSMFLATSIFFIFGSLVLTRLGGIGYMSGEELVKNPDLVSLFRGMSNHSQALGPIVAVFGVFLFADWMFAIQRPDRLYLALMLCCPILIWITGSRTALASFLAGLMMSVYFTLQQRQVKRRWRQMVGQVAALLTIFGLITVLLVPSVRHKVEHYIVKYDERENKAEVTSETILKSRQHVIDSELTNWRQSPIVGNGFQVSAVMKGSEVSGFRDILSAPVEKGTWTYAVLEEGGVIGMILFCGFILVTLTLLIRRKAYVGASVFFTVIMTNMGEFTIFSMSAMGGIFWFMTFLALVFDQKRMDRAKAVALGAQVAQATQGEPRAGFDPRLQPQSHGNGHGRKEGGKVRKLRKLAPIKGRVRKPGF